MYVKGSYKYLEMVVLLIWIKEVEMKELKLAPTLHGLFLKKKTKQNINFIETCGELKW